jgi:predicted nucleic acid-binding protein
MIVREQSSARIEQTYASDRAVVVWCMTPVEVWSGVSRKRRERVLGSPEMREARRRLQLLAGDWTEIDDLRAVRSRAQRLVEVHPLRSADALQLAAALVVVSDRPDGFGFVTLDDQLGEAAEREGFSLALAM